MTKFLNVVVRRKLIYEPNQFGILAQIIIKDNKA